MKQLPTYLLTRCHKIWSFFWRLPLKQTYFFHMGWGLTLRIFLIFQIQQDFEIFLSILGFFNGKKIFFAKILNIAKKWFLDHVFFYFFSALCEWGGWVLKSAENSALFFSISIKKKSMEFSTLLDLTHPPPALLHSKCGKTKKKLWSKNSF